MKRMRCPLNGWRGVDEFAYGGEFRETPDPEASDETLADGARLDLGTRTWRPMSTASAPVPRFQHAAV